MNSSLRTIMARLSLLVAVVLTVGCTPATPTATTTSKDKAAAGDSHAGHDHGHDDTGPHGGHLLHLEPTGTHAEWTHDDDKHLITVHLDDFDAAKIVSAKFVAKIGDNSQEYPLTAIRQWLDHYQSRIDDPHQHERCRCGQFSGCRRHRRS